MVMDHNVVDVGFNKINYFPICLWSFLTMTRHRMPTLQVTLLPCSKLYLKKLGDLAKAGVSFSFNKCIN